MRQKANTECNWENLPTESLCSGLLQITNQISKQSKLGKIESISVKFEIYQALFTRGFFRDVNKFGTNHWKWNL